MGIFDRLKQGLSKTRDALLGGLGIGPSLDPAALEALEEALLRSDLGAALGARVLDSVKRGAPEEGRARLKAALKELASGATPSRPPLLNSKPLACPEIVLIVGVNGSGKTTSTGKLAALFRAKGERVLLAAADTFRAAAVEQLRIWAERSGAEFYAQGQDADPAAVAFDAVGKGKAGRLDRVLIDTAGRLQTKSNLMEELRKVRKVVDKAMPGAPHRTLLVLDGTAGQNMISQARLFHEAVPLDGLVITKLDGTAKAGAVLSVIQELKIPVEMVGVGEALEDFQPFDPHAFAEAMVGDA
jgi:fused signal recognition particle receptor